MEILHLTYSSKNDGAGNGSKRIFNSIDKKKFNLRFIVFDKHQKDNFVEKFHKNLFSILIHKIKKYISIQIKKLVGTNNPYKDSIALFNSGLADYINDSSADLVNLHWISNEMISIEEIGRIKKPIVWTFYDMWPFLGSQHYQYLNKRQSRIDDWMIERKKKNFSKDINIVSISKWLNNEIKKSDIFKENKIINIPLPVDTNFWIKNDKRISKKNLNILNDKKNILFVSFNGILDERKGFDYAYQALLKFGNDLDNYNIIIVGKNDNKIYKKRYSKINIINFDYVENDLIMRDIYSASDILLMPSINEALGQVAIEAGSCELPTVAFENTGLEDVIEKKFNGYLSKYLDIDDFFKGISFLLKNDDNLRIRKNLRKSIESKFSYEIIGKKYQDLYLEILKK